MSVQSTLIPLPTGDRPTESGPMEITLDPPKPKAETRPDPKPTLADTRRNGADCWHDAESREGLARPVVIQGLLRRGEVMELAATAKGRKTWMALDLARCVATGGMFLETFQCAKGRVLYFDYELPAEGMDFRVSVAMGHDAAAGVEFYSLRHNPDIGTVEAIRAEVEASKPDLVIVDCLYAVPGAPVEENSNSEAAAFRRLFVAMAESTNTAFLLLHHTGKGAGIGRDVRDRGRGASSSAAVVDTVASIIPDGGGADFLQFEAVARSFRPMEESPLVVSFCTEDEPWRFIPTGTVPQSATPGQPRKSGADVLAAIMPGGSTKEQILEALGRAGTSMSEKTLRNRLADLEAAGDVRFTQTGKGLKTYFRA